MDREKVIETFDEAKELVWTDDDEYTVGYNNGLEAGKNIAIELLKEQPQIVRCKDCKKRYTVHCIQEEAGNINNQDDWFCADGVKKDA